MNTRVLSPLVAIVLLMPFVGKAAHMDDPLFLWAAREIAERPFDPYGRIVNWYGMAQPLHEVAQNPPLASYGLALAAALFGWSERALHLAFLLPAALAAAGIHRLAARFTTRPLLAALAAILTPAFLVSGTTLMGDVPMLALYVWALALWIEGSEEQRRGKLAGAAALATLAGLAKYFGATSALLMAAWSLSRKRKEDLPWLGLPVAGLLAYELATGALYDHGLLAAAAGYVGTAHAELEQGLLVKGIVALAFVGGALPLVVPRKALAVAGGIALLLVGALVLARPQHLPWLFLGDGIFWRVVLQMTLLVAIGISTLELALADLRARRDAPSLLLALWIGGAFLFAAVVNWTVNARSLLPLAPAVGILIARRLEGAPPARTTPGKRTSAAWLLAPAAALSLAVAWADLRLANAGREAAREIHARFGGGPGAVHFQGHWGFQHHLEELGGRPLDYLAFELPPGDLVVYPYNASNTLSMPAGACEKVETLVFPTCAWLATMESSVGAGFYAGAYGCLPYSFGPVPPERYDVLRITRAISTPR